MKKIVSIFLTVALMLGCISTVFAADTVSAEASASEVQTGETVTITYTFPTGDAFKDALALGVQFTYDHDAFELNSMSGPSSTWIFKDTTGYGGWSSDAITGDNISGKSFVVEFKCKDTAAAKAYTIAIEFVDGDCFHDITAFPDYTDYELTAPSVTVTVKAAPCTHNEVTDAAKPATCTESGLTEGKHCDKCGEILKAQNTIPALGHKFEGEMKAEGDKHTYKCTNTGCTEYGNATAHSGNDWAFDGAQHWKNCACGTKIELADHTAGTAVKENVVNATCTATGSYDEVVYCTVCNAEISRVSKTIDKVAHNYVENATEDNLKSAATCKDLAVYYMSCSECGAQSSETFSAGEKAAHNYVMKFDADNHWNECSVCGDMVDVTAHTGGTATCMHKAVCTTCGEEYGVKNTENHEDLQTVGAKPATCTEAGETGTGKCNACGTVLEASKPIEALGHDEVTDKSVAATCTETGLTEGKHCARCEAVLTAQEVIEALGHDEVTDKSVAATCTETGLTEGKHCARCEEVLTAQEVVKALGHSFGDWTVTKEPTCTEKGEKEHTCAVCEITEKEAIDALGHSFGDWTVTKEPTCTEKGEKEHTCAICEFTEKEAIDALGHSFKDGKCTVCNAADPNFKPADDTKPADTKPADTTKPETGDAGIAVWAALLAVSAVFGTAIVVKKRHA